MAKPCIICYRECPTGKATPGNNDNMKKDAETLKRFCKLFRRYIADDNGKPNGSKDEKNAKRFTLFNWVIDAGMYSCQECSKLVESFCELYKEMKSIELLLNWKVMTLMNVMASAQRVPSRLKDFKQSVKKLLEGSDVNPDEIVVFKKSLVRTCKRKLRVRDTYPRLVLKKYSPSSENLREAGPTPSPPAKANVFFDVCKREISVSHSVEEAGDSILTPIMDISSEALVVNSLICGMDGNITQFESEAMKPASSGIPLNSDTENLHQGNFLENADMELNDTGQAPATNEGLQLMDVGTDSDDSESEYYNEERVESVVGEAGTEETSETLQPESCSSQTSSDKELPLKTSPGEPNPKVLSPSEFRRRLPDDSKVDPNSGKHQCRKCAKEFSSLSGFRNHYRSIHLKVRYRCSQCRKLFVKKQSYIEHFKSVHMGLRVECHGCGQSFALRCTLRKHRLRTGCGRRDLETSSGKEDEPAGISAVSQPILPKVVTTCSTSSLQTKLIPDSIINPESGKHKCSKCSKEFKDKWACARHYRSVHLQLRFQCVICESRFFRRDDYNIHFKRVHSNNAGISGAGFKKKNVLRVDQKRSKKYGNKGLRVTTIPKCIPTCGKEFKRPSYLRKHLAGKGHQEKSLCSRLTQEGNTDGFSQTPSSNGNNADVVNAESDMDLIVGKRVTETTSVRRIDETGKDNSNNNVDTDDADDDDESENTLAQSIRRTLRTVHRCSSCSRTFSSNKRLAQHQQTECSDRTVSLETGDDDNDDLEANCVNDSRNDSGRSNGGSNHTDGDDDDNDDKGETHPEEEAEQVEQKVNVGDMLVECSAVENNVASSGDADDNGIAAVTETAPAKKGNPLPSPKSLSSLETLQGESILLRFAFNPGSRKYKCSKCAREFHQLYDVKQHYRKFHQVRYRCTHCKKIFTLRPDYNSHFKEEHMRNSGVEEVAEPEPFVKGRSPPAPKVVASAGSPKNRQVPRSDIDPTSGKHRCLKCPREFCSRTGFRRHYMSIHLKLRYGCPACPKTFLHQHYYYDHFRSAHNRSASGDRVVKCQGCDKSFKFESSLRKHLQWSACGKNRILQSCHICGSGFQQLYHFFKHLKTVHGQEDKLLRKDLEVSEIKEKGLGIRQDKTTVVDGGEPPINIENPCNSGIDDDETEVEVEANKLCEETNNSESATANPSSEDQLAHLKDAAGPNLVPSGRRSLRTVHRCSTCSRTFSTSQRLTEHQNAECSAQPQLSLKNGDDDPNDDDDNSDSDSGRSRGSSNYTNTDDEDDAEERKSDFVDGETGREWEEQVEQTGGFGDKNKKCKSARDGDTNRKSMSWPWSCTDCGNSYASKRNLDIHKTIYHPAEWKEHLKELGASSLIFYRFKCPDCDKLFLHLHSMLLHRTESHVPPTHESVKVTVTPDENDKIQERTVDVQILSFIDKPVSVISSSSSNDLKPNYKIFATIASPPKAYSCVVANCTEPFYSLEDFQNHSKLHGTFNCNYCKVTKSFAPDLAEHELQHCRKSRTKNPSRTGLYACVRCDAKFTAATKHVYIRHHLEVHLSLRMSNGACAICKDFNLVSHTNHTVNWSRSWGNKLFGHYKTCHDIGQDSENSRELKRCPVSNCPAYFLTPLQVVFHLQKFHKNVIGIYDLIHAQQHKRVKCKICGEQFSSTPELHNHEEKFLCQYDEKKTINEGNDKCQTYPFSFKCPACNRLFPHVHQLLFHHKQEHPPQKPETIMMDIVQNMRIITTVKIPQTIFTCPESSCSHQGFYQEEDLQTHSKLHGSFPCQFCDAVEAFAPELAKHELEHSGKEKLAGESVKIPINRNKRREYWNCPRCTRVDTRRDGYIRHHLIDHLSLPSIGEKCAICKTAEHASNSGLVGHYRSQHNLGNVAENEIDHDQLRELERKRSRLTFTCQDCGKKYFQIQCFKAHRLKMHVPPENAFPCKAANCKMAFETEAELKRHGRVHSSTHLLKFRECPKCNKIIGVAGFSSHMKYHKRKEDIDAGLIIPKKLSKERPHVCELCGKTFKEKKQLDTHYLAHSGPSSWNFQCSVCSKKCLSQGKLKEHMRTHTKEKPFVCDLCGEKYAHRHNLRIHVNSKHGDVTQDIPMKRDKTNLTSRKGIKRRITKAESSSDSDDDE